LIDDEPGRWVAAFDEGRLLINVNDFIQLLTHFYHDNLRAEHEK
jgi:hypothetical protein